MPFDIDKKNNLAKLANHDKSKKGSVDEEILWLVEQINGLDDFHTLSSCAGRVMLIGEPDDRRKDQLTWLLASHQPVDPEEAGKALDSSKDSNVWLKMEGPILHVCARDFDSAARLLDIAERAGFRRKGLISVRKRFIAEMYSSQYIEMPVRQEGRMLLTEEGLKDSIRIANQRLEKSREILKRFSALLDDKEEQH